MERQVCVMNERTKQDRRCVGALDPGWVGPRKSVLSVLPIILFTREKLGMRRRRGLRRD